MLATANRPLDDPSLMKTAAYVDGRWVAAASGEGRPLFNVDEFQEMKSLTWEGAGETPLQE